MKTTCLIFIITALGIVGGIAEPDVRIKTFETLPAEDALYLYSDSNGDPEVQLEMMRAALRDKRMDLIPLLFKDHSAFPDLIRCLNEMSASKFKVEVVVTLLRTEAAFWKNEEPEYDGSRGATFDNAVEPFVGTIGKLLPSVSVDEKLFSTKARRLEVATELERAIAKENGFPGKERIRPEKERGTSGGEGIDSTDSPQRQSVSKRNGRNQNRADQGWSEDPFTWWVTAGCIGLLFTACAVWFKVRISRSHS